MRSREDRAPLVWPFQRFDRLEISAEDRGICFGQIDCVNLFGREKIRKAGSFEGLDWDAEKPDFSPPCQACIVGNHRTTQK